MQIWIQYWKFTLSRFEITFDKSLKWISPESGWWRKYHLYAFSYSMLQFESCQDEVTWSFEGPDSNKASKSWPPGRVVDLIFWKSNKYILLNKEKPKQKEQIFSSIKIADRRLIGKNLHKTTFQILSWHYNNLVKATATGKFPRFSTSDINLHTMNVSPLRLIGLWCVLLDARITSVVFLQVIK